MGGDVLSKSKTIQLRRNTFYDPFAQIDRKNNGIRKTQKYYDYKRSRETIFFLNDLYFIIFLKIVGRIPFYIDSTALAN